MPAIGHLHLHVGDQATAAQITRELIQSIFQRDAAPTPVLTEAPPAAAAITIPPIGKPPQI